MKKFLILGFILSFTGFVFADDIHTVIQAGDLEQVRAALDKAPGLLEKKSDDNFTPLMRAVQVGKADIAAFLIEKGADINAAGAQNFTALHFSALFGKMDCARLLLEKGADVSALDVNKRTPLFFFVGSGDIDFCRALVEKGADVNAVNSYGRGPLLYALWRNQEKAAEFLIEEGARIDAKDNDGLTLLHHMCVGGQDDMAAFLVKRGADIKTKDNAGHTPLHLAAFNGAESTALEMIEKGADVNARDDGGDTPLHGAAWKGLGKTAALLLEHGADIDSENTSGRTPLDYAMQTGYNNVIDLLKKGGAVQMKTSSPYPAAHSGKVGAGQTDPVTMTILYDNTVAVEGTRAEWGFSCLIEGTDETILLDTGGEGEVFMHNANFLKKDLKKVDKVVISHNHWDHTGGLMEFLKVNPDAPVYIPYEFPYDFVRRVERVGGSVVPVREPCEISKNVYLTGQMGDAIKEMAVVLNTPKGLVMVMGCSHPGIAEMVRKSREAFQKDIYLVFGGFHLMEHSDAQVKAIIEDFREMGVRKCGATHCTGDRAISLFREAFGDDYVPIGTGRVLKFTKNGLVK